jgi:hypothetical protein
VPVARYRFWIFLQKVNEYSAHLPSQNVLGHLHVTMIITKTILVCLLGSYFVSTYATRVANLVTNFHSYSTDTECGNI